MNKAIPLLLIILTSISLSCTTKIDTKTAEDYKNEIAKAEKDFEKMVAEKGIATGFHHFADANAVIKRENDTLIIGKENIQKYYSEPKYKNATVSWSPDFITVSESGDMGYTYGKYRWEMKDADGNIKKANGVFHTVWKRQNNGNWKYVWD